MLAFVFRLQFLFRRFMSAPLIHDDVFFAFCGYEMGCLLILHGNECYSVVLNYFLILPCLTRNFSLSSNDPPFLLPTNVLLLFFTFYLKVLFQGVT